MIRGFDERAAFTHETGQPESLMETDKIVIRGARQHNLKNIDIDLPRNRLVVITGLSGSGKSTLAFDTLYAEGQRRYVESLSTYARQFLERMEKPDVDLIEGLSPAIAIEQKTAGHNPRSTVGTVTEIYDFFRLLFARVGIPHCARCGVPVLAQTLDQILDSVLGLNDSTRVQILSPLVTAQKGSHEKLFRRLKREGFSRIRVDGAIREIETVERLEKDTPHTIEAVVDRLTVKPGIRNRLADSLELAVALSGGRAMVEVEGEAPLFYSEKAVCLSCGTSYPEFTPASFSFNSPQGACPRCAGIGATSEPDPDLIVPNPELSLREGAVAPWAGRSSLQFHEFLEALTAHYGADLNAPFKALPEVFKQRLFFGSGSEEITFSFERDGKPFTLRKVFEGVIPELERRYRENASISVREDLHRYMSLKSCPDCGGARLNPGSRSVKVGGAGISEIASFSVENACRFFQGLALEGKRGVIARRILKEITDRLGFLENVGLSYLTLDRSAQTLSGGESQRIRLATQIGSKLTGVLYVLDEPSIGLHQRDNQRLLAALIRMRDLGNTVLIVEHDQETILSADYVVDMGPGAGEGGGEVVFSGRPDALLDDECSLTGQYLSGRKRIEVPSIRRSGSGKKIVVKGARENNLKNIDVAFPIGCFTCVTGVSGSGKSTLVLETLYRALSQRLYRARITAGAHAEILGLDAVDKVVNIDQSPIGRTPRSNPATYTGVFSPIRELFSKTPESRMRGYKSGRFSFNVKGGRCEACTGDGIVKIEMHFLPDLYVPCDVCRGKRYNRETLEIRYRGENIAGILDMTVHQALSFFEKIGAIRAILQTVSDVGIGYIRLGQSATTLSGGEAQRIKLARELSRRATGRTVYILDEPTTGLHSDDIQKLLHVLFRLVAQGNTVIVIEHNLDVIKSADHVIDLGPEGGDGGGYVIAAGTPEEIAAHPASHTGRFLERELKRREKQPSRL
jgi:excinuclease ABC subunit A